MATLGQFAKTFAFRRGTACNAYHQCRKRGQHRLIASPYVEGSILTRDRQEHVNECLLLTTPVPNAVRPQTALKRPVPFRFLSREFIVAYVNSPRFLPVCCDAIF